MVGRRHVRTAALAGVIGALALVACGGGPGGGAAAEVDLERATTTSDEPTVTVPIPTTTTAPPTTTTTLPEPLVTTIAAGRPRAAGDPTALAAQIVAAERAIRDPATAPDVLAAASQLQ